MSDEQYLAWENAFVQGRHEFVDGEVFAMTGTSMNHNEATLNLIGALRGALAGTPCRVFGMDIKVRVAAANAFFYPDIVVKLAEMQGHEIVHHQLFASAMLPRYAKPCRLLFLWSFGGWGLLLHFLAGK